MIKSKTIFIAVALAVVLYLRFFVDIKGVLEEQSEIFEETPGEEVKYQELQNR